MAHTHLYYEAIDSSLVTILKDTGSAQLAWQICPSGHDSCQINTSKVAWDSILVFKWALTGIAGPSENTDGHTHAFQKVTGSTPATIRYIWNGKTAHGHSNCVYNGYPDTRDYYQAISTANSTTTAPTRSGGVHWHGCYHDIGSLGVSGQAFVGSLATCPSGHTNCQTVGLSGYSGYSFAYVGTNYNQTDTCADPSVTTLPATDITDTTAILDGLATPLDVPVLCGFEIGYDLSYGTTWYFNSSPSSSIYGYSVGIGGLCPDMTYHFRALLYDGGGYYYGADAEFTTTGTAYPAGSKLLKGRLTYDGGGDCMMRFQWGTTVAYGNDTQWVTGKITGAMHSYPLTPDILTLGETYHYRAQARNKTATADGVDMSFVY